MMRTLPESDLAYFEIKNPLYCSLENHVKLEMEWSASEKNLYSYCWGLLSLSKIPKEDIALFKTMVGNEIDNFEKIGDIRPFLRVDYISGLCLAVKILHDNKMKLSSSMVNLVKNLLYECERRNWLDIHEFVSSILFSLASIRSFEEYIEKMKVWLEKKYGEFMKENNYESFIDCAFALSWFPHAISKMDSHFLTSCMAKMTEFSDERLAKLVLFLRNIKYQEKEIHLVEKELHDRLENEFRNQLGPSLEHGLRELLNLMHSGCSPKAIVSIVQALKEKGIEWAKEISTDGSSIIIHRPPKPTYLPKIDPKTHSLALLSFKVSNRIIVYQLDREEFQKALDAVKQRKPYYKAIRIRTLCGILFFTILLTILTFGALSAIHVSIEWSTFWETLLTAISNLLNNPLYTLSYALSVGFPYLLLVIFWIIDLRALNRLFRLGDIERQHVIDLVPGLRDLVEFIFGKKGEKNANKQ